MRSVVLCNEEEGDIELMRQKVDDVQKFLKELYYNYNFVIEKVTMKAKEVKEELFVPTSDSLMKVDELRSRFPDVQDKIKEYDKLSLALKIETDDELVAAENKSSEIHEVLKNVEKVRQVLKAPYFNTCKEIDAYAKTMIAPLEKAKKRYNDDIARYKVVQAAMIKAQEEKEMQRIAKLEEEKNEEKDKIARINEQLNARLYGGIWINKSGKQFSSIGCLKEDECDELMNVVVTSVPKPETFVHYSAQAEEMINHIKDRIAKHKINLHNLNGDSKLLREDAMTKINEAKIEANVKSAEIIESIEKKIDREIKSEVRGFEKSYQQARKGVAEVLKFVVIDEAVVPREFFTINEDKLRDYMRKNNDQIRSDLKDNKVTIPGVKFYIDDSYRSKA